MFEKFLRRILSPTHHYCLSIEGDGNPGAGGDSGDVDAGVSASPTGPEGTPPPADPPAASGGALAALADDGTAITVPADWPKDWRDRFAGKNEAELRLAKRYGSPEGVWKKLVAQEKLLSDRSLHRGPTLPENATDEQVAEYRKALGIPDAPDGYDIKWDAALQPADPENAMLGRVLERAHAQHVPPAYAKAMFDSYQAELARAQTERAAEAQRALHYVGTALRKEFGADLEVNRTLTNEFLDAYPGIKKLTNALPMADLDVTRDLVKLARELADEGALYGGDSGSGGKSIDTEIAELNKKKLESGLSETETARRNKLYEQRMARDARRERRSQAA